MDCDVNPADSQQRVNSSFELKKVTISDVFKKLQEVNVAKASGYDNIPNKILKIAAPVISISLADLFNLLIITNTSCSLLNTSEIVTSFSSKEELTRCWESAGFTSQSTVGISDASFGLTFVK